MGVGRLERVTYDEARLQMSAWLEQHATTSPDHPHAGYDEMDGALPRGTGAQCDKLFVALSFWDGWIDASNHDWRYYEPIAADDWPRLAREIAAALREDRELVNPTVLDRFGLKPRAKGRA